MKPNIVLYVLDDVDLERIPIFTKHDAGARAQHAVKLRGRPCAEGGANCSYDTPRFEGIARTGVAMLGAHVPVSICTPSRYSLLTGRLPSSSPYYSASQRGRFDELGSANIGWNTYLATPFSGIPCRAPFGAPCTRRAATLGSMLQRGGYFTGFVGKYHLAGMPPEVEAYFSGRHGRFELKQDPNHQDRLQELERGYTKARQTKLEPLVHVGAPGPKACRTPFR